MNWEAEEKVWECLGCHVTKSRTAFSGVTTAATHTCKVYRNPECTKGTNCKEPIIHLSSKHMPSTLALVVSFMCETCRNKTAGDARVEWSTRGVPWARVGP